MRSAQSAPRVPAMPAHVYFSCEYPLPWPCCRVLCWSSVGPGGRPPGTPRCASRLVGGLAVVSRGRRGRRPLAGRVVSELRSSGGRPWCVRVLLGSVRLWGWLLGYAFYITSSCRQYSAG